MNNFVRRSAIITFDTEEVKDAMKEQAYFDYRAKTETQLEILRLKLNDPYMTKQGKYEAIQETKNQMKEDLDAIFKIMVD